MSAQPEEQPAPAIIPLIADGLLADDDWAWTFLASYTGHDLKGHPGNLSKAYRSAGISKKVYETRRENDTTFRLLCEQADDALADLVEEAVHKLATIGDEIPIIARGEQIGTRFQIDGPTARWYLERIRPEKYHLPTVVEHVAPGTAGAFTFQLGEEPLLLEQGESET